MEKSKLIWLEQLLLLSLLLTVVAGCSKLSDPNVKSIESAVKTAFTLPDKELMEEVNNPDNAEKIGDVPDNESTTDTSGEKNGIEKSMQERYGDIFTDYGYDKFTLGIASIYPSLAEQSGYQTRVEQIKTKQDKDHPERYRFEVKLNVITNQGEEKKTTMFGKAECSQKEGKIDSLNINDDGGLAQEMSESAAIP